MRKFLESLMIRNLESVAEMCCNLFQVSSVEPFSTIVACQSATFACVNAVVCCSTVSTDCSGHGERVTQSGGGDLSLHSQDRRSRKEGVGLREAIARWRCAPSAARGSRPRAARRAALRLTSLTTSCTSSWLNVRCTEHARQSAHTRHPAAAIRPRGAGAGTGAGASVPGRTSPSPNSSILERPPRTSATNRSNSRPPN